MPHGVANAINLPHVIRFNAAGGHDIADRYRDVAEVLGVESGGSDAEVGDALAAHVSALARALGLPSRLSEVGVPEAGIPALVEGAMGDGMHAAEPARAQRGATTRSSTAGRSGSGGAVQLAPDTRPRRQSASPPPAP